jgi:hypothetical protein
MRIAAGIGIPGDAQAGQFSPMQLPGAILWVRADQGITIATGVSQWNDLSGSGHNLTQGTGANQPTFVASAKNGFPGVQFNGTSHSLSATFTRAEPHTVIATAQITSASGGLYDGITVNRDRHFKVNATTVTDGDGLGGMSFATTEQNNWHANIDIFNGASSSFRLEDNVVNNGNSGPPITPDGFVLGGLGGPSNFAACTVAEVIIYSRALTATEIAIVIAYMKSRYALP